MLNEHDCKNCVHYPICTRKEAMQNMIAELKTHYYFTDYDGSKRLIHDVDWLRLTITCSFYNPKMTKRL